MNNRGFSYFELLLVLALIIIVSSMVTVSSTWLITEKNTAVVAKQISAHLNYIQQKAIEESRTWVIEFVDTDNRDEYFIYPLGEQSNPRDRVVISEKQVFWGDKSGNYLPDMTIKFNAYGAPVAKNYVIGLNNQDNELYVTIATVTGTTKITDSIK